MNAVTLTSSFPATVQPGIPKLGTLPDGWTRAPLGQFLKEVRRPLKMVDNEEYRLVTVKRARGGVIDRGRFLGKDVLVKSQFLIEPGDFLISKRQIVHGACGLVPQDLGGSIVSNEYSVLNGTEDIDLTFLNFLAHSIFFQQTCFHSSIGVHVEKMIFKLDRWLGFEFDLPPLPEQRKIADILSTWERAIEATEALLATARTRKRALMQSLLTGKRRFPEFEGQEWKEVRLGQMGQTVSGGTPDSTETDYWDGDVHWATPTDITKLKSRFIRGTSRMITQAGLSSSSAKLVPTGSILICTRATIGEMAIATGPIPTNQGFKNLVLADGFDSDFIYYLFQFFKSELIRYACGLTFLELSKKDFDKRSFKVPSLPEQRRIAAVINATEEEIDEHRQNIEKLRTEKKALMQQLLTGKRRVTMDA